MNDERDFWEDEQQDPKEIIGYCAYCKTEIYIEDKKVEEDGLLYHKECFILENTNLEKGVNDD